MYEIEAIIKQTFGCPKEVLSERDLELILNTKVYLFIYLLLLFIDDYKR